MTTSAPAQITHGVRADQLRDGDLVYVTGRWQVLANVRAEADSSIRATTGRGSQLFIGNPAALFAIASR